MKSPVLAMAALLSCSPVLSALTVTDWHTEPGCVVLHTEEGPDADGVFELADDRFGRFLPATRTETEGNTTRVYYDCVPAAERLDEIRTHVVWRYRSAKGNAASYAEGLEPAFRAVPLSEIPAVGRIRIACVGDSITHGMGIPNPEDKYPEKLQKLLDGDPRFPSQRMFEVRRFGHSAKTAGRVAPGYWYGEQPEHAAALAYQADIYISNLGINDTNHGTWDAALIERDYAELIQAWRGPQGALVILWNRLCPDFRSYERGLNPANHPGHRADLEEEPDEYFHHLDERDTHTHRPEMEAIIDRLAARYNCPTIDMYAPLVNTPSLFSGDGLHPTPDGTSAIARHIKEALIRLSLPQGQDDK
ncbi:MAG: GDSL-type esterase/lipase family protein [Akkermansia sp.]|nr:GDSL-type esterase/lipase family protein [Akkermansia sp.]